MFSYQLGFKKNLEIELVLRCEPCTYHPINQWIIMTSNSVLVHIRLTHTHFQPSAGIQTRSYSSHWHYYLDLGAPHQVMEYNRDFLHIPWTITFYLSNRKTDTINLQTNKYLRLLFKILWRSIYSKTTWLEVISEQSSLNLYHITLHSNPWNTSWYHI